VIHTVGPVWRGGRHGEPDLLAACYRSTLSLAVVHGLDSIAFPAISCGVYGYPLLEAATIAIREVRAFAGPVPSRVLLVTFNDEVRRALHGAAAM
jgi:O-acetyl-ADP-ribose deacetylase (regulator of RNase III)